MPKKKYRIENLSIRIKGSLVDNVYYYYGIIYNVMFWYSNKVVIIVVKSKF